MKIVEVACAPLLHIALHLCNDDSKEQKRGTTALQPQKSPIGSLKLFTRLVLALALVLAVLSRDVLLLLAVTTAISGLVLLTRAQPMSISGQAVATWARRSRDRMPGDSRVSPLSVGVATWARRSRERSPWPMRPVRTSRQTISPALARSVPVAQPTQTTLARSSSEKCMAEPRFRSASARTARRKTSRAYHMPVSDPPGNAQVIQVLQ